MWFSQPAHYHIPGESHGPWFSHPASSARLAEGVQSNTHTPHELQQVNDLLCSVDIAAEGEHIHSTRHTLLNTVRSGGLGVERPPPQRWYGGHELNSPTQTKILFL